MSNSEIKEYRESLNALGIRRNKDPFPLDPPKTVDYWADNKKVLEKIIQAQIDSLMFTSSFIYIFYGPVGGGKTFAVRYLANPKTQKLILSTLQRPDLALLHINISAVAPLRTGQLTFSLYRDIVKKCFSAILKNEDLIRFLAKNKRIGTGKIGTAFRDIKKSIVRSMDGKLKAKNLENSEGYKLLTVTRSRLGKLDDVNELVETIGILIRILSEKYWRIIISIDELENLARATGTERVLCSDFLRKMHEMIEHDLTLFLVFTFDSFEEVKQVLQPALLSRVKESIEFPFIKEKSEIEEYIRECIALRSKVNPYDVLDPQVIKAISESLVIRHKGRLSFRIINNEMHDLFTLAYIFADRPKHKYKIDYSLYKKIIKRASVKEIVKRIMEQMGK